MARNEIDLHDTHGKPDELSAEEVARWTSADKSK